MSKQTKIKQVVRYGGHSQSDAGVIKLNLKANFSELVQTVLVYQLIGKDVILKAKLPGGSPFRLGNFKLNIVTVDKDGVSKIKMTGLINHVEIDKISCLPMSDSDVAEFVVLYEGEIEDESPLPSEDENDSDIPY